MRPDFSTHPRPPRLGAVDIALLTAACLLFVVAAWASWRANDRLQECRAAAARTRADSQALARELKTGRPAGRARGASVANRVVTFTSSPPPAVMRSLEELLPADVRLSSLRLKYGAALHLDMRVVARSPAAYDRFVDRLAASPRFDSLALGSENRSGEMSSTITATYHEAVAP